VVACGLDRMCCLVSNAIEKSKRQITAGTITGLIMIFIPVMTSGGFKYYTTHNSEGKGIYIINNLDVKTLDGIDKICYCVLHSDRLDKSYMKAEFNLETNVNKVPIMIYNCIID
jgi:hypothetical protein